MCLDIAYIWTQEGWLYLAVFIDLFKPPGDVFTVPWLLQNR